MNALTFHIMVNKILCVAEKNSIAKAVAGHLSGGHYQTVGTFPLLIVSLFAERDRQTLAIHSSRTTRLILTSAADGATAM